jgi:hypothetical protein
MTSKVGLIPIPFTGGFYKTRSKQLSDQRLINWYVNVLTDGGLNDKNLYPTAGIREIIASVGGINRGSAVMNGRPYFVNGNTLYRINRVVAIDGTISYTTSRIGGVGDVVGSGRVFMDAVKTQLCIVVPGVAAYIHPDNNTLYPIADIDFDGPVASVVATAGVFVFLKYNSNKIFHSNLNDGQNYTATDFYTVNQMPVGVGLLAYRNLLYVFGENNIVPFQNIGGLKFLFAPQPNAVIPIGLRSNFLVSEFLDSYVWVGSGENAEISVWRYSGGSLERISTEPIDFLLQNATDEELATAFLVRHSKNGADFIVLSVGDYSLAYNLTASQSLRSPQWHEVRSALPEKAGYTDAPWRVNSIIQAYNRIFVGDSVDGRIGELDDTIGTEYGSPIYRLLDTQPLSNMGVKSKVKALEVFTDVGVAEGDVISLSWSDDGGYTYSNTLLRSLGEIGDYGRRVVWSRLGAFSIARKLRIEYSGPYPRSINKIMGNAN